MPFDIDVLRSYQQAGDRVGYWTYLGQFDAYGRLAAGVATNETSAGYVANSFFSSVHQSQTGLPVTATLLRQVGLDLMQRDLAARNAEINENRSGLHLSARAIADYHGEAFSASTNGLVGKEGWTAWSPMRDAIQSGDDARAGRIWGLMLQDTTWGNLSIYNAAVSNVFHDTLGDIRMSPTESLNWLNKVRNPYVASWLADSDSISFRNTERINGWSRDPVTGEWKRPNVDVTLDNAHNGINIQPNPDETASPGLKAQLDAERQARFDHYGLSTTHRAESGDNVFEKNGDLYNIDVNGLERTYARYDGDTSDSTFLMKSATFDQQGNVVRRTEQEDDGTRRVEELDPHDLRPDAETAYNYASDGHLTQTRVLLTKATRS